MPVQYPSEAGKSYRPSNGTEGMIFQEMFCDGCKKDTMECDIVGRSMLFDLGDEEYPSEWVYDDDGRPTCTAFEQVSGRGES